MCTQANLENRLARLERQNALLRASVMTCVLVAGILILAGAALTRTDQSPPDLTVRSLVVVDADGRTAVKIIGNEGLGSISMWETSREGWKPQLSIGCIAPHSGGGTQIFMKGADGQRAINLVAQKKGTIHTW